MFFKKSWDFIKKYHNLLLTIFGLVALLMTAYQIKLYRDDFNLRWRPELFMATDTIWIDGDNHWIEGKDLNLNWHSRFEWRNSGGSPALKITTRHIFDKEKRAFLYKSRQDTSVIHFTVYPGEVFKEGKPANYPFTVQKKEDTLYLHKCCAYSDRRGKRYWCETIYFICCTKDSVYSNRVGNDEGHY